jgi:hypothetical protein
LHQGATLEEYDSFFDSDDMFERVMVGNALRVLKRYDNIDKVTVSVVNGGEKAVTVSRADFEEYLGESIGTARNDWTKKVMDPMVYDDSGREVFIREFKGMY